jgi:hypothetical protein
MNRNDRVLARRGARELSVKELEAVSGGIMHTNVASLAMATTTHTTVGDGDAGGDFDITQ